MVIGVETCAYHSQWLAVSPEKYQAATRQRMISPPNAHALTQNSKEVKAAVYMHARRQLELRTAVKKVSPPWIF